jgi:hypothetical protein
MYVEIGGFLIYVPMAVAVEGRGAIDRYVAKEYANLSGEPEVPVEVPVIFPADIEEANL